MFTRAKEIYLQTRKPIDNFWTAYLSRPFAAIFVAWLEPKRITPNQVTILSFLVGIASAAWLALVLGHWALIVGALLFQLAYVLDCVDGMLARARKIASPQGHLLDFLMDELKAMAFFGAVSIRLYRETAEVLYLFVGVLGLVALASGLSLTTFTRRPELAQPTSEAPASPPKPRPLPIRLLEAGAKFLIHYPSYFLYVAIFNYAQGYLFVYAGINALYYARTFLGVVLRMGRGSPAPAPAASEG